jgi:hypothetical protein
MSENSAAQITVHIWVGSVWVTEAYGSWGDGRTVVVPRITEDRVRVRNLDTGIRTWITRNLFDNNGNFPTLSTSVFWMPDDNLDEHFKRLEVEGGHEWDIARRRGKIPTTEYIRLMHHATLPAETRMKHLAIFSSRS